MWLDLELRNVRNIDLELCTFAPFLLAAVARETHINGVTGIVWATRGIYSQGYFPATDGRGKSRDVSVSNVRQTMYVSNW